MTTARRLNPSFCIVVPVYNEAETIPALWESLQAVWARSNDRFSLLFVDDGSTDESFAKLSAIASQHPEVRILRLSRNFGHQAALTAGIEHAEGDALILMDADLQDRPDSILTFVQEWKNGTDVVYAVRTSRKEGLVSRTAFRTFYRLMSYSAGIRIPMDAGIFGLLDRRVVNVLKSMPERNRYFPGLRAYAGFVQRAVPVEREARHAGTSRVRLSGLVKLAADGLISFSYLPIRVITGVGMLVAFSAFGYALRVLYKKLVSHEAILGWASTLTAILFLGGLQLVMLGLIGEYIGRIYEEVKQRPYYIVADRVNF